MGNFIFGGGSKSLNKGGLLTCRGRKALPLSFTLQPQAKTVDEYSLATFSCEVTGGAAPYTYQWKKNGTNVGTNSDNLSFTAAAADKNASITVVVTDNVGTVITSTPVVLGVTSYVYQLDGLTQSFKTSSQIIIPASTDFEIEITDTIPSSSGKGGRVLGNESNFQSRLLINAVGSLSVRSVAADVITLPNGAFNLFDVPVKFILKRVGSVTTLSINGTVYTATGTAAQTYDIGSIGLGGGIYAPDSVRNLKVTIAGVVTNLIPLNNKLQGATQLAAVGTINATIVNYNAAGWVAI